EAHCIVLSTRFLRADERVDVIAESIHVGENVSERIRREESFSFGEITKGRSRQSILAVQRPGNLAGIERDLDFVRCRRVEGLCQEIVRPALRVECAKEPKLVLNYWTTNIATNIGFRKTVGSRSGKGKVFHFAHQAFRGAVAKDVAVKFVSTAFGNHVKDSAGGLAIFSAIGARLNLDFLHKLEGQIRAGSTKSRIGRVHAVVNVIIFWP